MKTKEPKTNECVIHLLYSYEITSMLMQPDDLAVSMKLLLISKKKALMAHQRVEEIILELPTIDRDIEKYSKNYEFDRISKIDLSILRWAFYLLKTHPEESKEITQEAIRLSKKFSSFDASKFIHAVIDEKVQSEKAVERRDEAALI